MALRILDNLSSVELRDILEHLIWACTTDHSTEIPNFLQDYRLLNEDGRNPEVEKKISVDLSLEPHGTGLFDKNVSDFLQ